MSLIRVGDVAELPPGKGKLVDVGDRRICVYNVDGRFFASSSREGRVGHGPTDTTHPHGALFDVYVEDSPARVRAGQEHLAVRIEGDDLFIDLP